MKFPIFASVIVFVLWLAYEIRKAKRKNDKFVKEFWKKEDEANSTRRKSLADLEMISIPLEKLSIPDNATESMKDCYETLRLLSERKITNLSDYTNTELKLKYGAPNFPLLSEWDENFTTMVQTLQRIAVELYKSNNLDLAEEYLSFAMECKTDVSQSYYLLADIYEKRGEPDRIVELELLAENLSSVMKNSILENLGEAGPHSDFLRNPY